MKKYIKIIIFICLFFCIALMGCSWKTENIEYSIAEDIFRKQNLFSYAGQSAAVLGDRIFYISQEESKNGVYSMCHDGSDVKIEFEVPKTTKLIVTSEVYYYIGLKKVLEKNEQIFALYGVDRNSLNKNEVIYSNYNLSEQASVVDAYVTESGTIAVLDISGLIGSAPPQNGAFVVQPNADDAKEEHFDKVTNSEELKKKIKNEIEDDKSNRKEIDKDLYISLEHDGLITSSDFFIELSGQKNIIGRYCSYLDAFYGEYIMSNLNLLNSQYFKVLFADNNTIICSLNNKLIFIERSCLDVQDEITLKGTSEEMKITYIYIYENNIFALLNKFKSDETKLFIVNTNEHEVKEVATFNKNKLLLHLEKDKAFIAEKNIIKCNTLDQNGIGETLYEIDMKSDIVTDNIFEIAGDWLFIYKRTAKTSVESHRLIYKVNIRTKEIIEVKVRLS
ncbi:MAG: hypothetical protein WDA65_03685 [Christensenellales bacterium]